MSHDLRVSAPQGIFLSGLDTKFRAYVGGFGSGKTFVGCLDLGLFAGAHPGVAQGYFAPTYRDIRDTFWPTMDEAATLLGFRAKVKSADKEIELYRGRGYYGTIICRSMDEPGGIVGFKIARGLVDEIDVMAKDKATSAWRKIIARMRLVVPGVVNGIGVTTTPEGFKFVYDTFKRAPKRDYSMVQASTYENEAFLPPDYIQSLRDSYPQELIDAYLMGEFVNLTSGTVYRNFSRVRCRSSEVIRESEPLHIGQDFNVNAMASVVYVERPDGWHAVAELGGIVDTPALIDTIRAKWPGHHVTVYPDASGKSRKTVNASTSDIALLKQAGLTVRAKDSNPAVKDRILSMNTGFEKGRLWINDRACPRFADALEQQAYDKNGEPDKSSGHDHLNDAGGYPMVWLMPVRKPMAAPNVRFAY
ncbi:terminase large subunit domain-containing protein [Frigidibacter sp. MR17.24]|uniref:terminase large subunit domain-containing protein n=1 Tax=Frigidibacter sp. MR17.24 TaxID=3127345 RepID=UPI003013045E